MKRRGFIQRLAALGGVAIAAKAMPESRAAPIIPRITYSDPTPLVGYWDTLGDLYQRRLDGETVRVTCTDVGSDKLLVSVNNELLWVRKPDIITEYDQ